MTAFKGNRVVHEFIQTNPATPEKVFPLLCPVREADWFPGWNYRRVPHPCALARVGITDLCPQGVIA